MGRRYVVLDVFTAKPLEGNPLAVVIDAEGLSDAAMQAIAKEFNLSETVFVLKPTNPAHTASVRIFTPAAELPFAGHPTVGAAILLAEERVWSKAGACDALIVLEAKGGILRVGVKKEPGEAAYAEFDAPKLPQEIGPPAPDDRLAAALGLAPSEIGFENHKPSRFSAGAPFTFVPIANLESMKRARLVQTYWQEAFAADGGQAGAYLYCRETIRHKASFHVRMFAPSMGVPEDPATGSGAIAFAAAIMRYDDPPDGVYRGMIEQGIEMKRPSEIALEFEIEARKIKTVRIGGNAVIAMQGELFV